MTRPLRVLYIDGVGPFGGASRSLLEAMSAFPDGSVERYFVVQRGTAGDAYARLATDMISTRGLTRFDNTRASAYRGARWLVVLRELSYLPFTVKALLEAQRRWPRPDLIHVNEICEIVPGLLAKKLFGAPLIIHVRSLQSANHASRRTRWLFDRLRKDAAAVIAIDENVRERLPQDVMVDVIHNAFLPKRTTAPDQALLDSLSAIRPGALVVGYVGHLQRAKGVIEICQAARIAKDAGHNIQYVVVGGENAVRGGLAHWLLRLLRLEQNASGEMMEMIAALGLQDDFIIADRTMDIQTAYERFDVCLFPSYYDACGRPVFEAAFSGVPSIAAVSRPKPDTLIDGETGIAIDRPDAGLLAEAIMHFARNPDEASRMGQNALKLARRNFVPATNAARLLALYRRVVARVAGAAASGPVSQA